MSEDSFLAKFDRVTQIYGRKTAILTEGRIARTYEQLFGKALRIAKLLTGAGVHEETVVGIGISKSDDYIACMLGVWLAGGAFVPVDPKLPRERAQFIINQSKMAVILAKAGGVSLFDGLGARVEIVDDDWSYTASAEDREIARAVVAPQRLAYIIYTSGSTGRPKGVMVCHSGITNFIEAQIQAFKLNENSVVLFFLSTNFDASVSDIGTALLAGSTLCIEPQALLQPGPHFDELLRERGITHMDIPPALLRTMDCTRAPDSLETIIIGGEACAPDVVRRWAGRCLVVNVYGPTEATVCTSLGACDPITWSRPLIGQPLPNVSYHLFDEAMQEVPTGTPAQLYIGGIQVARGYVDEPELTKSKFVTVGGERLYRTGDLIVRCQDGEYQFLGRIDRQFKLRGMLIEPEEIEARIGQLPQVERSAVVKRLIRPDLPGEKLVAFVLPKKESSLDGETVKTHLGKFLPRWMVPQVFEIVEQLPMTLTGKVDLSALRDQPLSHAPIRQASSKAATDKQAILMEVWKKVLGVETIGLEDDFFALGGDSLNVVEAVVAAHLRGLTIAPDLFAIESTIAGLSAALEERERMHDQAEGGGNGFTNAMHSDSFESDISMQGDWQKLLSAARSRKEDLNGEPSVVFLTGVTGFLGARVLAKLLDVTDASKLFCLVRASSDESARQRIRQALLLHSKELSKRDEQRVTALCGDMEKVMLGLDAQTWKRLTNEVDTVFHSAATVNMVRDYSELRPANVGGTREVIRFLAEGRRKRLHYASTLSVFVATSRNTGVVMESDSLQTKCEIYGGYAQSKYAAELLLRSAEDSVGPISYYRFGLLTGDSDTGRCSRDDFLCMFAKGISTLGLVPATDDSIRVDVTPVDFACDAMIHIALDDMKNNRSATYHIANEHSLSLPELIDAIKEAGFEVKTVAPPDFLGAISSKFGTLSASEAAACLALCRSLGSEQSFEQFRTMDLFQATGIRFDRTNTNRALQGTGISCPNPSRELILKYLALI